MANEEQVGKPVPFIPMPKSDLLSVLILGGAIGLLVWGLGALLDRYVFDVYFCQGEISAQCASAKNYAASAASIVAAIVGLTGLVRLRVYRPLLVLIASLVSTWGVVQLSWGQGWFTGFLIAVVLYAAAFGLFSWVARIREFWISLIVIIVLVVAVRLAITS